MAEKLNANQNQFIRLIHETGIRLTGGDYWVVSGASSHYYYNFGAIGYPDNLLTLGRCFATKVSQDIGTDNFDSLFGPSMKGISIVMSTSIALQQKYKVIKPFFYNRPEEKNHGAGGLFMGEPPGDGRVLIVDDVINHGTTKDDIVRLLKGGTRASISGILVGVDRSEGDVVERFVQETGIPLYSIVTDQMVRSYSR